MYLIRRQTIVPDIDYTITTILYYLVYLYEQIKFLYYVKYRLVRHWFKFSISLYCALQYLAGSQQT